MKSLIRMTKALLILFCFTQVFTQNVPTSTQRNYRLPMRKSAEIQRILDSAVENALIVFAEKGLQKDKIAVTVIDLRNASDLKVADFRGDQKIYPASVVKLFYLVAVHQWLKDGRLIDTPELRRAMRDMIVDSSNDATHFIVDVLTGATGGSELSPKELKKWAYKREAVNRYFKSLGYNDINVVQKTYCEDIYGRERQYWNGGKNRNLLTTNSTARLLAEIVLGHAVDPEHSRQMMELLRRDPYKQDKDPDTQDIGFTGIALKNLRNAKLWSKAGWTSSVRHDAAYVETEEGLKLIIVVFTEIPNERQIIPTIAERVIQGLKEN